MGTTDALRTELDDQREEMGRTLEAIGDRVSPRRMVERGKDATTGRAKRAVHRARERVMGTLPGDNTVSGTAGGVKASAGDQVHRVEGAVMDTTRSNAVAAGAIAFGVGFLAAMAFPKTRAEQQAAQKVSSQLETAATEIGSAERQVADELKPALQQGVEQVKETASSAVGRSS